jgi:hypothetical protein
MVVIMATPLASQAPKTYLQLCEEELRPRHISPESCLTAQYYHTKAVAIIQVIALTILVGTAFSAVAIYFPALIPVAAFSALFILWTAKDGYLFQGMQAQFLLDTAEQLRSIRKHYTGREGTTAVQMQRILNQKGVPYVFGMEKNDKQLTQLKPVLARHLYWEDQIQDLQKKQAKMLDAAGKAKGRDKVYELRSIALELENEALVAKVKCAFVQAMLRKPKSTKTFEGLGKFSPLSGQERAIAIGATAPQAKEFFVFNKKEAITFDEAKRCTISQLATQHFYKHL